MFYTNNNDIRIYTGNIFCHIIYFFKCFLCDYSRKTDSRFFLILRLSTWYFLVHNKLSKSTSYWNLLSNLYLQNILREFEYCTRLSMLWAFFHLDTTFLLHDKHSFLKFDWEYCYHHNLILLCLLNSIIWGYYIQACAFPILITCCIVSSIITYS